MLRPTKTLMACVIVAAALLASVTTTFANRISVTSRTFRSVWTPFTIRDREALGTERTVRCNLTLEGSFHSGTIAKVAGSLVGYINRASLGSPCTGGTASVLRESLPWHLEYSSFVGTLPSISELRYGLSGFALDVNPEGEPQGQCLVHSESRVGFLLGLAIGAGVGLIAGMVIYALSRGVPCGLGELILVEEVHGAVTVPGTTTQISVRLI